MQLEILRNERKFIRRLLFDGIVIFFDGYRAQAGDLLSFARLTGGPITASFFDQRGQELTGYTFGVATQNGTFSVAVNTVPDVSPVPLPASFPVLLAGLGFLALRRRLVS